ncbi:MAG: hypothetical protein ACRDP7_37645, partial [Trebonia sp.]
WALAIGHASAGPGHAVSFVRPTTPPGRHDQGTQPPEGLCGLRVTDDGLWIAAAVGRYTHVRLTAPSGTLLHPLYPVAE